MFVKCCVKTLEKLDKHIDFTGGLSESQFEFRRGRSIIVRYQNYHRNISGKSYMEV